MRNFVALLLMGASLTACGNLPASLGGAVDCSTADGHEAVFVAIREKAETELSSDEWTPHETPAASKSKIRAALQQIKFELIDVRTSKEDPNSTKKFCVGKLKMTFPDTMITESDKSMEMVNGETINNRIEKNGAERDANSVSLDVDFNIQPTDDKKKVFAEIENSDPVRDIVNFVTYGHLYNKQIAQQVNETKQAEAAAKAEEESAQAASRAATLEEAKATLKLTEQTINATWAAIPQEQRGQLLPLQRAWNKKKTADCRIEAASASIDPTEKEAARMHCEARMNQERTGQLRGVANQASYQDGGYEY